MHTASRRMRVGGVQSRALSDWRNGALSTEDVRSLATFSTASSIRLARRVRAGTPASKHAIVPGDSGAALTATAGAASARAPVISHATAETHLSAGGQQRFAGAAVVHGLSRVPEGFEGEGEASSGVATAVSESVRAAATPRNAPSAGAQHPPSANSVQARTGAAPEQARVSGACPRSPASPDSTPEEDLRSFVPKAVRDAYNSVYLHPALRPEFDTLLLPGDAASPATLGASPADTMGAGAVATRAPSPVVGMSSAASASAPLSLPAAASPVSVHGSDGARSPADVHGIPRARPSTRAAPESV